MTFNPWRALRSLPHIALTWEARDGILGSWSQQDAEVVMHPRQSQRQRRCTLAHELVHAELEHDGPCDPALDQAVHREAARRLITIEALADGAAFHGDDLQALADELWVDDDTLRTRLEHLHPAERGYLRRRLSAKEESA